MGKKHPISGKIVYLRFYPRSFLPKYFLHTRSTFMRSSDANQDIWYKGDEPEHYVEIPEEPIHLEFDEKAFRTIDEAVFDLNLTMTVRPRTAGDIDLDDIQRCVQAYDVPKEKGEQGSLHDETRQRLHAKRWLENQVRAIPSILREFHFVAIARAEENLQEFVNELEKNSQEIQEQFANLDERDPEEYGSPDVDSHVQFDLRVWSPVIASLKEQVIITQNKTGQKSLREYLEGRAIEILGQFNFTIDEGSFRVNAHFPANTKELVRCQ